MNMQKNLRAWELGSLLILRTEPFCGLGDAYFKHVLRRQKESTRGKNTRHDRLRLLGNYDMSRSRTCVRLRSVKLKSMTGHCRLSRRSGMGPADSAKRGNSTTSSASRMWCSNVYKSGRVPD